MERTISELGKNEFELIPLSSIFTVLQGLYVGIIWYKNG